MLAKCDCKNDWQDAQYGKGVRVHNEMAKGNDAGRRGRCTVCGKERAV